MKAEIQTEYYIYTILYVLLRPSESVRYQIFWQSYILYIYQLITLRLYPYPSKC